MARTPPDAETWDPDRPAAPASAGPAPDVGDRYDEGRVVGSGGLADVRAARDRKLGREVAVKRLRHPDRQLARARFLREVQVAAQLEHPNIVPVHDVDVDADGAPFYTMRFVRGEPLSDALDRCRDLDERLALLPKVLAVCQAMAYAHERGILHRDLKPGNVMLGPFGEAVVVDWGLARILDEADLVAPDAPVEEGTDALSTRVGAVQGTPAYMAPEQARGEPVGRAADVYALGAILYEVLTGGTPRASVQTAEQQLALARRGTFEAVADVAPDCPRDLAAIVERALARDADARYASASGLSHDLERWTQGRFVNAYRYSALERVVNLYRRYRVPVVLAIAGLVATTVVATVGVVRTQAEADRAVRSERVAQRQSAALLRDRADRAFRDGAYLDARSYAIAALQLEPASPGARGLLLASWGAPSLRREAVVDMPFDCLDMRWGPEGTDDVLCVGSEAVARVGPDGDVRWRTPVDVAGRNRRFPLLGTDGSSVWVAAAQAVVGVEMASGAVVQRIESDEPRGLVVAQGGPWWIELGREGRIRGPQGFERRLEGSFISSIVPRAEELPLITRGDGRLHPVDGTEVLHDVGHVTYGAVVRDDGGVWMLGSRSFAIDAETGAQQDLEVDDTLLVPRGDDGILVVGSASGALYLDVGDGPSGIIRWPGLMATRHGFDARRAGADVLLVEAAGDEMWRWRWDGDRPPVRLPEPWVEIAIRDDGRAWLMCGHDGRYRLVVDGRTTDGTVDASGPSLMCRFLDGEPHVMYRSQHIYRLGPPVEALSVPDGTRDLYAHQQRRLLKVHGAWRYGDQVLGDRVGWSEGDTLWTVDSRGLRSLAWRWDGARYQQVEEEAFPEGALAGLPDGSFVVDAADGAHWVRDDGTASLSMDARDASQVALLEGNRIVTGGWDGRLRFWDGDGALRAELGLASGRIGELRYLETPQWLHVRTFDGSSFVFDLDGVFATSEHLVELQRQRDGYEVREATLVPAP